jgi:hypothetical protein
MESNGHWIQSSQKDPYRVYYLAANWIGSMVSYLSEDDLKLFSEHGFYSSSNKNGYVRDHIVSRKVGWLFDLPPELLRHPANLQLISHSSNIKKGWQERAMQRSDLEPMIIDLISRIENWTTSWPEQEICLILITQMKGGVRWETFF